MRRIIVISALAALSLFAAVALGWIGLFSTIAGRGFIKTTLEAQLSSALGGQVKIGALEGDLPGEIILRDVVIADDASPWASVDAITLDWRPFALINKKISVDALSLDGASFLRAPPRQEKADENEPRGAISLPHSLPNISVRKFSLSNLRVSEAIAGREVTLDGAGMLRADDGLLRLRFDASSQSDTDVVNSIIEIDPAANLGVIDVVIASEENGAIASLLGLGGGAFVEASANAPLSAFEAQLAGELGAYGSLNANLKSDLTAATDLAIDADVSLGDKLADVIEYAGSEAHITARLRDEGDNIAIELSKFESPTGEASGLLRWTNRGDRIERAYGRVDIKFAADQLTDIQEIFGESASLETEASYARGGYDITASLSAPAMSAALANGRTDLDKTLSGHVTIKTAPDALLSPPIAGSIDLAGDLDLNEEGRIALNSIAAALEDGSTLAGDAAFTPKTKAIAFTGDLSLSPEFLKQQVSSLEAKAPFVARVTAIGTTENFSLNIDGESAEAMMNGADIPAAETSARLAGLPKEISAAISATAIDQEGELTLLLKRAEDGNIDAPRLHLESPSFDLSGAGSWNPSTEVLSIDLSYDGVEGAQPYPGVPLSGAITAKGEFGRGARQSDLHVTAKNASSGDVYVAQLELTAAGPADKIKTNLKASGLSAPGVGAMETLAVDAAVNLAAAPIITLTRLDGERYSVPLSLLQPATLKFEDGVEAKNVRLRYGSEGEISLDGRFAPTLWRASIAAKDLPLPEANGVATFAFSLDTGKTQAASGDFTLQPLLSSSEAVTIGGEISWDGKRLHLLHTKKGDPLTFDIEAPLLLTHEPKISLSTDGELSGYAALQGALQDISPYFPGSFQTIEGKADARFTLSGTLEAPALDGKMTIRDGAYTEIVSGLTVTGITADASAVSKAGDTKIDFTVAARGAGQKSDTIRFAGRTALGETTAIDAELKLDKAAFSAGPVTQSVASGSVKFTGPLDSVSAAGDITVDQLDAEIVTPETGGLVSIEVVEANGAEAPQTAEPKVKPPPFALDVNIDADDRIFIRGRGLESEWKANIHVTNDAQTPVILGTLEMRKGTLDFSGRRFTFKTGVIAFDRLTPNDPTLNLRAEYETSEGVTAAIVVSGRASSPSVTLTSSPSLPSEDIMALILFGKPAAELSALESLQVAEALAQLSGVGPFGGGGGVSSLARNALGLDLLNIDLDTDAGASSLEVGKYVAQGLFVSAKQDARGENGSVKVEYEINSSISIETELQQDGDQTVSANWKKDF